MDELLAEDAERLLLFVLLDSRAILSGKLFENGLLFFIGLNLDKRGKPDGFLGLSSSHALGLFDIETLHLIQLVLLRLLDLSVDREHYSIDSSPLVAVFGLSSNNAEAFQNVDDVVDSAPLSPQLKSTLVQQEQILGLAAVETQEALAQLSERLLLPTVLVLVLAATGL